VLALVVGTLPQSLWQNSAPKFVPRTLMAPVGVSKLMASWLRFPIRPVTERRPPLTKRMATLSFSG
jgi:hypothetical protein